MSTRARSLAGIVLLAAGLASTSAQVRVTPPASARDAAALDPAVRAAVDELTGIVARRDVAGLKQHLKPDTKISFGGDHGPEGLDLMWEPARADTTLWRVLGDILALGGVQSAQADGSTQWCAPWPSCINVITDIDPDLTGYDIVIVTGTDVAVRAQPDIQARVLGRASHQALTLANADDDAWRAVKWHGGIGYVRSDLVRSPVDYRITLRVTQDAWTVLYFVGGD